MRERRGPLGGVATVGTSGVLGLGQTLRACLYCIYSCGAVTCQSAGPIGKCNNFLTDEKKRKKAKVLPEKLSLEGVVVS